jgi:hypothetical protein
VHGRFVAVGAEWQGMARLSGSVVRACVTSKLYGMSQPRRRCRVPGKRTCWPCRATFMLTCMHVYADLRFDSWTGSYTRQFETYSIAPDSRRRGARGFAVCVCVCVCVASPWGTIVSVTIRTEHRCRLESTLLGTRNERSLTRYAK